MADKSGSGVFNFIVSNFGVIELVGVFGLLIAFAVYEVRKTSKTLAETEADPSKIRKSMMPDDHQKK